MIQNTSGNAAPQRNTVGDVVGDRDSESSLPAALSRCNSVLSSCAPIIPKKIEPQLHSLPPNILETIYYSLTACDLISLSRTCKPMHNILKGPLDNLSESINLSRLPRQSRLAALKKIAKADIHPVLINNLIAAYEYIPSQQRPLAKQAILDTVALIPESHIEKLPNVGRLLEWVESDQKLVDAFHDGDAETAKMGIAQIMTLEPENKVLEFQKKCFEVPRLPQQHQWEAFTAILENTQNPKVLEKLTLQIGYMQITDQRAAFYATLKKTADPKVLVNLSEIIGKLPDSDRVDGWLAIFNKTQDPQVFQKLIRAIFRLPDEFKNAAWLSILEKTKDTEVFQNLAEAICYLPTEFRNAGWNLLFNQTQDLQVLKELALAIRLLPEANRRRGWDVILKQTQDPQVLQKLSEVIPYLSSADRDKATRAIHNAQIRASRV